MEKSNCSAVCNDPEPIGEIYLEIRSLLGQLEFTHEIIDSLKRKLSPVLSDEVPGPKVTNSAKLPSSLKESLVGRELGAASSIVQNIINSIDELIVRVRI